MRVDSCGMIGRSGKETLENSRNNRSKCIVEGLSRRFIFNFHPEIEFADNSIFSHHGLLSRCR